MSSKNLNKGLFVTFEGGEGSGKTTLLDKIYQCLQNEGYDVIKTRAPGGTPLGVSIRSLVLHQDLKICPRSELLLFLADRAQHVQEVILPAIEDKKIILCDRFTDSTLAYQLGARKIDKGEWLYKLCQFGCYGLEPDVTFFLDIEPKKGLARAKRAILHDGKESYDRLENEALKFHENVYHEYLDLVKKYPQRIHAIDASHSEVEVFERALHILKAKIENRVIS